MHALLSADAALFHFINSTLGNPVFDVLLPLFRERLLWAPLYVFLAAFFVLNYGKKGWMVVLIACLAVGLADFTSSTLIKKNVRRIRPCNDEIVQVQERVHCGGGYSFPSSHAANHFAAAVMIGGLLAPVRRWIRPVAWMWAAIIAFSQVYVGVHYPIDVTCGAILGILIGWAAMKVCATFFSLHEMEKGI
ncbi:MAG: phosphatase PAP2 family protein [Bacteroidetes bacterium]|nr:phosphatase PAP2 family protein [Bacteroidota bacterium]